MKASAAITASSRTQLPTLSIDSRRSWSKISIQNLIGLVGGMLKGRISRTSNAPRRTRVAVPDASMPCRISLPCATISCASRSSLDVLGNVLTSQDAGCRRGIGGSVSLPLQSAGVGCHCSTDAFLNRGSLPTGDFASSSCYRRPKSCSDLPIGTTGTSCQTWSAAQ